MKVVIGSLIILFIFAFGVWLMLSPTFGKVGKQATKIKKIMEEDKNE
ncbi:hypothetical protein NSQ93_22070 [Bacillus sp. FSL W8-0445]|nr:MULTISPECIES: hypothetical protein [Bacillota]KYC77119.1 hypothetical protein B4092_4856 [Bacillus licheniformis]MDE1407100.1 hypothetical protein [Bacillus licheniformis]TWM14807.1 hypothetical protein CHCC15091_1848 [Bacillus licheniformis]TWN76536.1 hypothetical protein CHCC20494_0599 [Bacillus licheniformis]GIN25435.1 hypothetical protein J31TS2_20150 [Bacillus licheniformis]